MKKTRRRHANDMKFQDIAGPEQAIHWIRLQPSPFAPRRWSATGRLFDSGTHPKHTGNLKTSLSNHGGRQWQSCQLMSWKIWASKSWQNMELTMSVCWWTDQSCHFKSSVNLSGRKEQLTCRIYIYIFETSSLPFSFSKCSKPVLSFGHKCSPKAFAWVHSHYCAKGLVLMSGSSLLLSHLSQ